MKREWRRRLIFALLCTSISLLLGYKRFTPIADPVTEYAKYDLVINEVMTNNRSSIRDDEGDFEDWIEIYNKGDKAIDLNGFGLTNESKQPFLWTFPDITLEPKSFCMVWASEKNKYDSHHHLHTNFKLKNKDRAIILTAPGNKWSHIFVLEPIGENVSYGRFPDGSTKLYGFDEGTPGKSNKNETLIEGPDTKRLEGPLFSHKAGFYTEAFNLGLSSSDSDAIIYYTCDGSVPTEESELYSRPIPISAKADEAAVIRARAYKEGYPKSEVVTHSYFVSEDIYSTFNTPVISLVTDPENLFDYENGIYVPGKVFDEWNAINPDEVAYYAIPANYHQRGKQWEKEAGIELFQPDGRVCIAQNIGIRVHGGYSRANNLKSLSLFTRMDYDDKEYFSYDLFDGEARKFGTDDEIDTFRHILLRTSATDSPYSFFRDVFIQDLVQEHMALDTQSSKPCIVYINGKYYGIHNIREAYDKNYISSHYGINLEDVVMVKNPTGVAGVEIHEGHVGDEMHYNRIIDYIKQSDLKIERNYDYINTLMDVGNFVEYNVLQIYCDNRDWPGNNVCIWRKRTQFYSPDEPYGHDGRWRWVLYDLDYGFGLHEGVKSAQNNSLARATDANGPGWPNPPWSTFLLRSLMQNRNFKNQFINTFADRLNTVFSPNVVTDRIEAIKQIYYPNVEKHITRWNLHDEKIENWLDEIDVMKAFAIARPSYIRQYIVDYFGLSGIANIKIQTGNGGIVRINSLEIEPSDIAWEGIYFKDIPITVEAVSEPGFMFVGWEGIDTQDETITVNLSRDVYIKAVFQQEVFNKNKMD